ncbi:MAG: hypothetical protein N2109_09795 [Fimbriimonadales bacterium]|nr:hypothetical protein [Fimbriimonadales bacterium]
MTFCAVATLAFLGGYQAGLPEGQPVLPPDGHLETPVAGLERTRAEATVVPVAGQPFRRALRVSIRGESTETNATQLTVLNAAPVQRGDVMLAELWIRGSRPDGSPARAEFLFERSTSPWTKSVTRAISGSSRADRWRLWRIPFESAEDYAPGQAMASVRLAFGPQTVWIGGLRVVSYGRGVSLDALIERTVRAQPLGAVEVRVDLKATRQTMFGLGGNFCQPRYGRTEAMDAVGRYCLENLSVAHARVGLPLDYWAPERGRYVAEGQALAAMEAMGILARRRIPIVVSVWEGPQWMLPGRRETSRPLPAERYDDCIEAVVRFLLEAKRRFGAEADSFSFNEPDYGVNFRFTPQEMASFIRRAGPRFREAGLKTRFVVADTANGANFANYAQPLLEDQTLAPYLGPLAFHSWDALSATDEAYRRIAELGRIHRKPVWCLEAGHDAQLWQARDPWGTWENALRTALAYERTLRLTGAEVMDYWTYQDNYPLVDGRTLRPHPVFRVMQAMERVFVRGSKVCVPRVASEDLRALATVGPGPGRFALLLVNPLGPGQANLVGLPAGAVLRVRAYTADSLGSRSTATVGKDGRLRLSLPARSVLEAVAGG